MSIPIDSNKKLPGQIVSSAPSLNSSASLSFSTSSSLSSSSASSSSSSSVEEILEFKWNPVVESSDVDVEKTILETFTAMSDLNNISISDDNPRPSKKRKGKEV